MKHRNAEMMKAEMLAAREDIIEPCKIQERIIKVKGADTTVKKGPCEKIDGEKCGAYISPAAKWRLGNCPLATHIIVSEDEQKAKNPLKASKQKSRR
jgi:hypothetical protein